MWVVLALEIAISIWIFYSLPVVVSSVRPFLSELVRTYSNTSDSQQLNKIQYNVRVAESLTAIRLYLLTWVTWVGSLGAVR